jgi:magnesium chelatase family protein
MDRIDIHIELPATKLREIVDDTPSEPSSSIGERVTCARSVQQERSWSDGIFANARTKPWHIRKYCRIDAGFQRLTEAVMNRLGLSAWDYNRVLKMARTIADIEGSCPIATEHISEAIQDRSMYRRIT